MTRPVPHAYNHDREKVLKLKTFDSFLCPFRTPSGQIEHIIQRDKTNLLGIALKILDV